MIGLMANVRLNLAQVKMVNQHMCRMKEFVEIPQPIHQKIQQSKNDSGRY